MKDKTTKDNLTDLVDDASAIQSGPSNGGTVIDGSGEAVTLDHNNRLRKLVKKLTAWGKKRNQEARKAEEEVVRKQFNITKK